MRSRLRCCSRWPREVDFSGFGDSGSVSCLILAAHPTRVAKIPHPEATLS